MINRRLQSGVAFILLSMALVACRGGADKPAATMENSATDGPAARDTGEAASSVLVFSHALKGEAADALENVVKAFDDVRDDLTLNIRREQRAGLVERVEQSIVSGDGPDVFLAPDIFVLDWIEHRHILQPLDQLMNSRGVSVEDALLPRFRERVTSAEKVYGMPLAVTVPLMVADPDVVRRGGDMSTSAAANASNPIVADLSDWTMTAAFFKAFDANLVDGAGIPAFDSEGASAAIEFIRANVLSKSIIATDGTDAALELFNSGAVHAAILSPDQVSMISPERPWLVWQMPAIDGHGRVTPMWDVDTLYVSSWSRHIDAAADLVAWIVSNERLDAMTRDGFPGLLTMTGRTPGDSPVDRGIQKQVSAAIPSPSFKTFRVTADIFAAASLPLISGSDVTPDRVRADLSDAASRARAAGYKIMQGQTLILR